MPSKQEPGTSQGFFSKFPTSSFVTFHVEFPPPPPQQLDTYCHHAVHYEIKHRENHSLHSCKKALCTLY